MDVATAAKALKDIEEARTRVADRQAECPPTWRLAFGGIMGALIAGQAAPPAFALAILVVAMACVALMLRAQRRRMGFFVNGYRRGRTRRVTLSLLVFVESVLVVSVYLKLGRHIWWAPLVGGAVVTPVAMAGWSAWQRAYRRELTGKRGALMRTAAHFDPVIHAPARLKLAALLSAVSDMEFATLREALDVSDSVLSKHLKQMETAGYVKLHKASLDGRVRTRLSITGKGRRAFAAHVAALQAVVSLAALPAAAE